MQTQSTLKERFGLDVPAHIVEDAEVPALSGRQRQGDCYVKPQKPGAAMGEPLSGDGIALIRGEAMGNTHLLLPSPGVRHRSIDNQGQDIGVVTVDDGAVAFIHHSEHGYIALAPGEYVIRRQREQADEIRSVTD